MNYLPIGLLAYVLSGFSLAIDKGLVRNSIRNPLVMAFYIGIFNLFLLLAIPFGFYIPAFEPTAITILSGLLFGLGVVSFLNALKYFDLLVAAPMIGMINPLVSSLVDKFILGHYISLHQFEAIGLLVVGGGALTINMWFGRHALSKKLYWIFLSGILFGLSYSLIGEAFSVTSFINVLVISRLSFVALVLTFLFSSSFRRNLWASNISKNNFENRTSLMLAVGQSLSAVSGFLIFIAVFLSTPALVNSLFSTQYIVLLIITIVLARRNPKYLHENLSKKVLLQKLIGLILISLGLVRLLVE
jgi:drug/metabolite transporter (DMT)-like permease